MQAIQLISAPSILGLTPSGVEQLADSLLSCGLAEQLGTSLPVIHQPTLNHLYSKQREKTNCLNVAALRDFSIQLKNTIQEIISKQQFALVLGGDCSILVGIMPAVRSLGDHGLIFVDAHADFYQPERSTTGEVADMDLAIVTGRGPSIVTNINNLQPYVRDEGVVHVGQKDWEETIKYGSQDIRDTAIKRFDLQYIRDHGVTATADQIVQALPLKRYWLHFDTDVLSDEVNPAVNYRLPGGLSFSEATYLLQRFLGTGKILGMSVTIFNPTLDKDGTIAAALTQLLGAAFRTASQA